MTPRPRIQTVARLGRLARFGALGAALALAPAGRALAQAGAPARAGAPPATPTAALETARYFPLDRGVAAVYDKITRYRFGRGETRERLTRAPVPGSASVPGASGAPLRLDDSEGESLWLLVDPTGAPAMAAQTMRAQGFEQRYDPPLPLFPARAVLGEEVRFRADVEHRTSAGAEKGAVRRRVRLEAVEDVEVPAGRFAGCLRFRSWTENRPREGGAFVARIEETTWLAPGVGEVKSVQEVALETFGVAWLRARITLELRARSASL